MIDRCSSAPLRIKTFSSSSYWTWNLWGDCERYKFRENVNTLYKVICFVGDNKNANFGAQHMVKIIFLLNYKTFEAAMCLKQAAGWVPHTRTPRMRLPTRELGCTSESINSSESHSWQELVLLQSLPPSPASWIWTQRPLNMPAPSRLTDMS